MKIQIDTGSKTIKLVESANLAKFVKFAKRLLGKEYDNFTLEVETQYVYWQNPVYIPYPRLYTLYYPWPYFTYTTAGISLQDNLTTYTPSLSYGENYVYNLEIQEVEEPIKV